MPRTRPYLVRISDTTRIVEATSREAAIGHVTRPLVAECRPAKPNDLVAFMRDNGKVETAGVYPDPEPEAAKSESSTHGVKNDGSGTMLLNDQQRAPDDAVAHDGHNVQTAGEAMADGYSSTAIGGTDGGDDA